MGLIQIIVLLAVVGLIVWAIVTYIPMAPQFKNIIIGLAIIVVVLWLLFGVFHLGKYDIPITQP